MAIGLKPERYPALRLNRCHRHVDLRARCSYAL